MEWQTPIIPYFRNSFTKFIMEPQLTVLIVEVSLFQSVHISRKVYVVWWAYQKHIHVRDEIYIHVMALTNIPATRMNNHVTYIINQWLCAKRSRRLSTCFQHLGQRRNWSERGRHTPGTTEKSFYWEPGAPKLPLRTCTCRFIAASFYAWHKLVFFD